MASPFAIFRKNQKAMYALLAIMCMVGFSIGGAIDYTSNLRSNEDPVIATAYGKAIRASEVQQLLRRRHVAVGFLAECKAAEFNIPTFAQFFASQFESTLGPATEEAVVETWVLDERARKMGMVVSDDAINKFLRDLTSDKVKSAVFVDIAKRLGVGQPQLFEALRGELLALRLREMALGRMQTTPAQRWDYYRRQKQRATVELVPLRVEDLIGDVPDAPTEELQAFFDAHKDKEPDPESPTPGFKVPKRAAFQVVTARFSDFYDEQAVTDDEIKKHYDDFKDTRYLWEQYDLEGDDDEPPPSSEAKSSTTTGDEKPADEKASDASADKPDEKADAKPPKEEDGKKSNPKPDEKSQSSLFLRDTLSDVVARPSALIAGLLVGDDEEGKPTATAEDSGDEKKPAEPSDGGDETTDEAKPNEKPADQGKKSAGKKPKPKAAPIAPPITDEYLLPRDIRKGPHPKHAALWKVEDAIRKELARDKANKKIDDALSSVREKMRKYARQLGPDETEDKMPDLAKAAKAQGLTEQDTGLLSALELSEKFPDLASAKGDQGGATFVQIAYSGLARFQSTTVQDIEANRYLVWKVEEQDAYVPEFADVRSKVLRVWKIVQARDLAVKKAKELAAEANKAGQPLAELFADREGLTVTQTPAFSWLTRGSADADNRSPLRISEVEGVESPGPEFMRAVFSLSTHATGEAMNAPQTIAYVMRLVSLEPSSERLRTGFFADSFALYNEVAREDMADVQRAWIKGIEAEANLTWKDPDKRRR